MKSTKAETLKNLSRLDSNLIFKIPKILIFKYSDWKKNKDFVINSIQKNFGRNFLAIRSSAQDEDKKNLSNAGKYTSIMNIRSKDKKSLTESINKVFKSYSLHRKIYQNDQILIQVMIKKISMSGVIFTRNLENGSPYLVVNYDDVTGLTSSVTSGTGGFSNRILYIHRKYFEAVRSARFKILIRAIKDLENKLSNSNLDIEFAVDRKLTPYLLQVRTLKKNKNFSKKLENKVNNKLKTISSSIKNKMTKQKNILGSKSIFGNMPDWNPAEIVGRIPRNLALSLFENLITDSIWCKARKIMGYRNMPSRKLLTIFSGQPFVDTRLSFNSFLPKEIKKKLGEKIVDQWSKKLKDEPHQHDKIEFEIAITCFSFDIEQKVKKLLPNLKNSEKNFFINTHLNHTLDLIKYSKKEHGIETQIKKIEKLNRLYTKYKPKGLVKDLEELRKKINYCKELGTLPFSILARHAFISKTILDSLVKKNILTEEDKSRFMESIKTITGEFLSDFNKFNNNKISKKILLKKYGHLRPGTYDITSKRYDKIQIFKKRKKNKNVIKKTYKKFTLSKFKKNKFRKLLKRRGIKDLSVDDFFNYFKKSIKFRELAKFYYTRYISDILEILNRYGKYYKIGISDVSNLSLNSILSIENKNIKRKDKKKFLVDLVKKNKENYETNSFVKLPQLIFDHTASFVVPHIVSSPNFVTRKKTSGNFAKLDNNDFNVSLDRKIVLIENADPGFDWIFNKKILALITKYGGANSHMAIRCSELNIPAAIGCGEKKFNELITGNNIELDCATKKITIT